MASKDQSSACVGAQAVLPFRRCLAWYLENNLALAEDDQALLRRWMDDDRTSDVWSAIQAHSEQHVGLIGVDAPIYFIVFILQMKNAALYESAANEQIAARTAEIKKLKTELTRKVHRVARQLPFEKRAEFWERTAERLQGCPSPVITTPRVRSDRNGSRARTYFIREVSGFIHDVTGGWLDKHVAKITEIAFDTNEIITEDTVRKARSK